MTIAHYQTTENLIKAELNTAKNKSKFIRELLQLGNDVAELLSQFEQDHSVYNIGNALIIKSPVTKNSRRRWIWQSNAEKPQWRELIES